jgi:predicted signal transduction protein with EAL and GGDEF domain
MRSLAGALRTHTDRGAVLGRLGGDEFAVVVPHAPPDSVLAAADALRASIARHPIVGTSPPLQVTASIGIALVDQAQHRDELLANADLALYEAKRAGRNRVQMFAPEHYRDAAARVSEAQRVRDALDAGNLTLYAQPIVDLSDLQVVNHEVLVRLDDGLAPPVGPADFLAALEHTDVVTRMDRWVVDQAVAALASVAGRATSLRLSVNVSGRSLADPTFAEHIIDALHRAGVEPPRLGLEISETAAITNRDAANQLVTRLSAAGCSVALDDFGAGFGSFASLKHLPYTSVKFAGEFIRHADGPPADSVIIDALVRLARGLGMRTVAEQVDRAPLPQVLSNLGVDHAQGDHLGRPRPLADLRAGVSTAV